MPVIRSEGRFLARVYNGGPGRRPYNVRYGFAAGTKGESVFPTCLPVGRPCAQDEAYSETIGNAPLHLLLSPKGPHSESVN
jgi:hypothetical protein